MTTDMKNSQKLAILNEHLPQFKEMISSFMSESEDEAHVIYLVTLHCSQKLDLLGSCFYLILQLLYNEPRIVHEEAILSWTKSAKERIANSSAENEQ